MSIPTTSPTILDDVEAVFAPGEYQLPARVIADRLALQIADDYDQWDIQRLATALGHYGIQGRLVDRADDAADDAAEGTEAAWPRLDYTRHAIATARQARDRHASAPPRCRPRQGGRTDRDSVRDALVDLLTHGLHPGAGRPGVLADIGAERAHRCAAGPWSTPETDLQRLAELVAETGAVGVELAGSEGHDREGVYAALVGLAASVLAWLDLVAGQIEAGIEADAEPC